MSITTFDIQDRLYTLLNGSASLVSAPGTMLTGAIYKSGGRPINSDKEDIVIGSLPINFEQIQQAVININIHVPNLSINIGGVQDKTKPNLKRLKELTALVIGIVDDKYYSDYWFNVQQQHLFEEQGANEYYSNIRLNFFSENIT